MIKRKHSLGATALLSAAGIAIALFHQRAVQAERTATEEVSRAARTEAEIAELRNEVRRARAQQAPTQGASPEVPVSYHAATAPAPSSAPETAVLPANKEPTTEDIRDALNVRFYDESVDTSWSQPARQKFQTRLREALPAGSDLVSIECKSSMCRAEISHPNFEAHQELIRTAFMSPVTPWEVATNVSLGEKPGSGKVTSVVFLAREGQPLPSDLE